MLAQTASYYSTTMYPKVVTSVITSLLHRWHLLYLLILAPRGAKALRLRPLDYTGQLNIKCYQYHRLVCISVLSYWPIFGSNEEQRILELSPRHGEMCNYIGEIRILGDYVLRRPNEPKIRCLWTSVS